jgi:biopolymer transport protein TolR
MGMSTGSKGGVKADINITPLVDVVLVLLIIFMVVTPMLQNGVDVQLPATAKPKDLPLDEKNQVTISIKFDPNSDDQARVFFGGDWQSGANNYEALYAKLAELHERSPGREIVIKADRHLTFGAVRKVMKACNKMGFESVSLITERNAS